jgi:transposase-like protein
VDETYIKVAGRWQYVHRAIDQLGQVIDVFASRRREVKAARWFFERAIGTIKVSQPRLLPTWCPCIRWCSMS